MRLLYVVFGMKGNVDWLVSWGINMKL